MTDYGRELIFGSLVTPDAQRPEQVVSPTRLSEQAGLDLATFQDHPYQPGPICGALARGGIAAAGSIARVRPRRLALEDIRRGEHREVAYLYDLQKLAE